MPADVLLDQLLGVGVGPDFLEAWFGNAIEHLVGVGEVEEVDLEVGRDGGILPQKEGFASVGQHCEIRGFFVNTFFNHRYLNIFFSPNLLSMIVLTIGSNARYTRPSRQDRRHEMRRPGTK